MYLGMHVSMMYVCMCARIRHPDTAAETNIQTAWCLVSSPVGSERAVRGGTGLDPRMPTSHFTPDVPFFRFSLRGKAVAANPGTR